MACTTGGITGGLLGVAFALATCCLFVLVKRCCFILFLSERTPLETFLDTSLAVSFVFDAVLDNPCETEPIRNERLGLSSSSSSSRLSSFAFTLFTLFLNERVALDTFLATLLVTAWVFFFWVLDVALANVRDTPRIPNDFVFGFFSLSSSTVSGRFDGTEFIRQLYITNTRKIKIVYLCA